MMLKEIRLTNFKCFEDVSVPLKFLTVLCGLNGMGKSSVIQAMLLLRQSHFQGALGSTGLVLNGDLIHLGAGKDVLYDGAENDNIKIEIQDELASYIFSVESETEADLLPFSDGRPDVVDEICLFKNSFQYLTAERLGPRVSLDKADYVVRYNRDLGLSGEYTAHFMSLFGEEKIESKALLHPSAISDTLKSNVEAWMQEVSPGLRISYLVHSGIDQVSMRFSFSEGQALTESYRSTNVGFGISYTLPVIVALLAAKPGSLLILENPEAHLHPKGQCKIGELIALVSSSGVQVIVETHSDHILNGIRMAVKQKEIKPDDTVFNFFYRKVEDDQISNVFTNPKINEDGRFDYWPDGFFDEWGNALDQLL